MTLLTPERTLERRGVALASLSVLVYALIPVGIALAVSDGVPLPAIYAGRTVLALGVVVLLARRLRRPGPSRWTPRPGDRRRLALVGGSAYCAQMVLYFASLTRLDVSVAGVLAYAYPALVALGAVAVGLERLGARQLVSLALSMLGITLVVGTGAPSSMDPVGVLMALGSAVAYAVYILSTSGPSSRVGPLASSAWVLTGATVISVALLAVWPPGPFPLLAGTGWLLLHGLVLLPVAVTCFLVALSSLGAVRLSIFDTLQPAITALAGVVVLGERLGWWQVAGAALVLVAAVRAVSGARPALTDRPVHG